MGRAKHGKLAVFDFSGTLTIDAPRFAQPDTLIDALRRSRLADLGVDTPRVFWDAVVHPTWHEGSTTGRGYAAVLTDAIAALAAQQRRPVSRDRIHRCAQDFTRRYLAASTVADEWGPWLRALVDRGATVVVATDHYADATPHIAAELSRLGVPAAGIRDVTAQPSATVRIANSADVGSHKSSRRFWVAVQHALVDDVGRLRIVDDFGANEHADDRYADPPAVDRRRQTTIALLADVFAAEVEVETFALNEAHATAPWAGPWRQALVTRVDSAGRRAVAWAERD